MLLAVAQLHLVHLIVVFFLLIVILVVAVLRQSADQLHKYLIVDEAALWKTQDVQQKIEPATEERRLQKSRRRAESSPRSPWTLPS